MSEQATNTRPAGNRWKEQTTRWKEEAARLAQRNEELERRLLELTERLNAAKLQNERNHRRVLEPHVLRDTLPLRAAVVEARAGVPDRAAREARLRAVSPAYVRAAAEGPSVFGNQVHRMALQSLNWWMPLVRPAADGSVEPRWKAKQRFPYRGITQTRELAMGGIMLDLGGNIGRMSISRVVLGDVLAAYCAEPDPLNYACLVGNALDNGLAGLVLPDHAAIADYDGVAHLRRAKVSGGHSLTTDTSGAAEVVEVPCWTLDSWVERLGVDPRAVSFVKVDVQGSEMKVLRGASRLLAHRHIAWQMEIEPALLAAASSTTSDLYETLTKHFTHFIDLNRDAAGERARPIAELPEALAYLRVTDDHKTDVLLYSV